MADVRAERAARLAELRAKRAPRARPGVLETVGAMLGVGVVLWWASVWFTGFVDGGEWPDRVSNLPFGFFALGCVWGFALTRVADAREATWYLAAPLLLGAFFWFTAVVLGGALSGLGASRGTVRALASVGFPFGAVLGCVPLAARLADTASGLRRRFSSRG